MNNNSEAMQLIKDMLVSVGLTEDVDTYAALFMFKVNNLAFDMYVNGVPQTAAELVLTEVRNRAQDEQRFQYISEILAKGENQHFLQTAAQQVAEEFSAIVNREA